MKTTKIVSDIVITDIIPKVKDPAIAKLLPKNLKCEKASFVLDGVNTAISNGLSRTICDELPVIAMYVPYTNITTTDPHHLEEVIAKRIRMIPLDQKTPLNASFSIDVINDSPVIRDVKSSEIKYNGKGQGQGQGQGQQQLPFNETFTLFTLAPGCMTQINDIRVQENYGYVKKNGMHVVAHATESIPLDVKPFDMEAAYAKEQPKLNKPTTDLSKADLSKNKPKTDMSNADMSNDYGTPTREANPHKFRVGFRTNGTMPARAIVIAACDNIIKRIKAVESMLDLITAGEHGHILTLPGESDTIGHLYMKTFVELYPKVDFVRYAVSRFERSVDIVVRFPDFDIKTMFTETSDYLIDIYKKIKAAFAIA